MNPWILIVGVIVIVLIFAGLLVFVAQRVPKTDEDPLQARLAELSQRGESVTLDDIELSQPFAERVVYPVLRRLGEVTTRATPQSQLQAITRKLELSGKAGWVDAPLFYSLRIVAGVVFSVLFAVVAGFVMHQGILLTMLISGVGSAIGYVVPDLLLIQEIKKRQLEIRKAMPDALDLLTICVEAGLGFDAAMSNVAKKWENQLSLAFARAIREIQLGKVRRDALKSMADRIDLAEMTSFVAAIIQSEQLGVSMAKVLRIQAEQMRMKRRQYAEELAHQAPVKMLLPMIGFIFPSIFIVLLTPAIITIMHTPIFGGK